MPNEFSALKPVESSMFSRAGYDEATWRLLYEFKSTHEIRRYKNVAPEVADEALTAKSIGSWWNQHIKGNASWEYDVLGADPSQTPEPPKTKPVESLSVMDEDIKLCEPGWNGHGIDPAPSSIPADQTFQCGTGEMGDLYWSKQSGDPEKFPEGQLDPQVDRVDVYSQHPDGSFTLLDGGIDIGQTAIVRQPVGEVLAAWRAPESAAEALDLLSEREGEIKAIIAQNVETGQQALTVRIDTAEKRVEASETLNRLVAKKDTTIAALDPLRKVLYEVYMETGGKVKAGVEPLEAGIKHVKAQILTWDQTQERIRQEALRKAREEAEAEARRLQEAEAERLKLLDVQDALDEGDVQRAETLFDAPVIEVPRPYIPPTYVPPAAPKIEGQSTSTIWKVDRDAVESDDTGQAYISSITALLKAVRDGKYPIDQAAPLLSWDFAACDKLAGALMAAFNVPGLTAAPSTTLRVSRGRRKKS